MSRAIRFRFWEAVPGRYTEPNGHAIDGEGNLILMPDTLVTGGCVVEQFTGNKDSQGVDIYEGDILRVEGEMIGTFFSPSLTDVSAGPLRYSWLGKVIWDDGYAQFLIDYIGQSYKGRGHFCGTAPWATVIGNIHQNQDLFA